MLLRLVTAAAFLVAVTPAAAQTARAAGVAAEQANAPAQPAPQKKTCHSEIETGSIMPHRICRTAAEWQEINAANQRAVEEIRNRQNNSGTMGAPRGD